MMHLRLTMTIPVRIYSIATAHAAEHSYSMRATSVMILHYLHRIAFWVAMEFCILILHWFQLLTASANAVAMQSLTIVESAVVIMARALIVQACLMALAF
jgi:hypothetical protein